MSSAPVLLYDGTCGFCAESVQLILRHDRRKSLRFASLQGLYGVSVRARHPELEGIDSIVWVDSAAPGEGERLLVRSDAALRVAKYLGGWWSLGLAALVLPRFLRDAAYGFVARHRHRLLASAESCLLPGADVRERFLDAGFVAGSMEKTGSPGSQSG